MAEINAERDIARMLSVRYHKDGSEILIARSGGMGPGDMLDVWRPGGPMEISRWR